MAANRNTIAEPRIIAINRIIDNRLRDAQMGGITPLPPRAQYQSLQSTNVSPQALRTSASQRARSLRSTTSCPRWLCVSARAVRPVLSNEASTPCSVQIRDLGFRAGREGVLAEHYLPEIDDSGSQLSTATLLAKPRSEKFLGQEVRYVPSRTHGLLATGICRDRTTAESCRRDCGRLSKGGVHAPRSQAMLYMLYVH